MTRPEPKLWALLRKRKLSIRRQAPMGRYIVDFVTIGGKLIVEIDGPTHSNAKALARDAEGTHILSSLGFHIVRITKRSRAQRAGEGEQRVPVCNKN